MYEIVERQIANQRRIFFLNVLSWCLCDCDSLVDRNVLKLPGSSLFFFTIGESVQSFESLRVC